MPARSLFATLLYEAELNSPDLLADLAHSIRALAADDTAGRNWSREHHYPGYTSYASLNDLPRRDPAFADLAPVADPPRGRVRQGLCVRPPPQTPPRQPVGECVEKRWATQWTHPPAQHHFRHLLRRGAAEFRGDPLRGPAPAADDGRAAARGQPSSPFNPVPACSYCGKAGSVTKCCRAAARATGSASASISPDARLSATKLFSKDNPWAFAAASSACRMSANRRFSTR